MSKYFCGTKVITLLQYIAVFMLGYGVCWIL